MKTLALSLALLSLPTLGAAEITKGNTVEHDSCAIALPDGMTDLYKEAALKSKGFSRAEYKTQLKRSDGSLVGFGYTVDESDLVSKMDDVHKGLPKLQAKLKSLRYSGMPELRLIRDGKPVPSKTETLHSHVATFIDQHFDVKDTDTVHAELVNVLDKAKVKKSDAYWYRLEFEPVHEITVMKTPKFTYRALAQEFLAKNPDLRDDEKLGLEIMAGRKVSESKRKEVGEDDLSELRVALAYMHLKGKQTDGDFFAKWHTAFPACKVKAKKEGSSGESESAAIPAGADSAK